MTEEAIDVPVEAEEGTFDPRAMLARWANSSDEWVRLLVAEILAIGRPVGTSTIETAYKLFRQEKAVVPRELPAVEQLSTEARQDEAAPPLTLVKLSEVHGVNALVTGAEIEPHEGLTILYGENGTGKTGYSRVFKALADSRTADVILGNVDAEKEEAQSAKLDYTLGGDDETLEWTGDRGVSPFTRMSIFDSPSVSTHVDDDLDYVYVPAALALFNHVIAAIQGVTAQIDASIATLGNGSTGLLSRFQRGSTIYPLIEALGASTDLAALKATSSTDPEVDKKIDVLTQAVAALRSNTIGIQLTARRREQRAFQQASDVADVLIGLDVAAYNAALTKRTQLAADYEEFRSELFAAADLPAEPEETWSEFIEAGDAYRQHLVEVGAHDADRCLYCRQPVSDTARDLLTKYSSYLADKISGDIRANDAVLASFNQKVESIGLSEVTALVQEFADEEAKPDYFVALKAVADATTAATGSIRAGEPINTDFSTTLAKPKADSATAAVAASTDIVTLEEQSQNRTKALEDKQAELLELKDAAELAKSWAVVEAQVKAAKEADQLRTLKRPLPQLARGVTELSKAASDQLINQSFDALFIEECEALRVPSLKVQFVGREGRAQRRKVLSGRHKPSKVLSEGEQKVLALADFLAEARLAGITAPVVFDDPVSSLDHRRVNEVAQRIARLADDNQVIVFTHDILFTTTLLSLFEKSKRCTYFQITDEDGKGKVARATGPRWDTLSGIKGKINDTINAAKSQDGEARAALVRVGYGWIRSWCEVFTETELFQGVSQRYQPNIGMTRLENIKTDKLGEIIPKVTKVFEDACRYIDAHSQPLVTLGVSPTLAGLEQHWAELQALKKANDGKS
ncbi:MAG TPA: AAA family ATPase [Actinomycetota bacterium]|nr:AAA family ATPase [Actinomycetota bacterium]